MVLMYSLLSSKTSRDKHVLTRKTAVQVKKQHWVMTTELRPLVVVVVITAAKEEVRRNRIKSEEAIQGRSL